MPQCPKLHKTLENLYEDIYGAEIISVQSKDGSIFCCFPDKEKAGKIPDLAKLIENSEPGNDVHGISGVILKGKHHFLARYEVPDMEISLCIYGKSSVNYGLLNSGIRATCSRIRDILYLPEE